MSEDEWLTATNPMAMLDFLRDKVSERKLRLFAVACCRRIGFYVTDPGSRQMVDTVELAADCLASDQELLGLDFDWLTDDGGGPEEPFRSAFMVAGHVGYSLLAPLHGSRFNSDAFNDAVGTAVGAADTMAASVAIPHDPSARFYSSEMLLAVYRQREAEAQTVRLELRRAEQRAQAALLSDIFGNPFRAVVFDPTWRTSAAVTLARTMYDSRDFTLAPVLADALEEADCTDASVLSHLRGGGTHVRGCWCVDGVLSLG